MDTNTSTSGRKTCTKCKVEKPLEEFHVRRASKDGRKSECKECGCARQRAFAAANPDKIKHWKKRWEQDDPERWARSQRKSKLKAKFGITLEEYEALLDAQGGVCAICEGGSNGSGTFAVDHDHRSGKNRKLLCSECNLGLGKFRDSPELLRKAAVYVEAH